MFDFVRLLKDVFDYQENDRLVILYDRPKSKADPAWKRRIGIAKEWSSIVPSKLYSYEATYANNADMPAEFYEGDEKVDADDVFSSVDIVIALTEFSATAPLHKYSKKYSLRIASMPGFTDDMMPALELDYSEVARYVGGLYDLLEEGVKAKITFVVDDEEYMLNIDLLGMYPLKDDGNCRLPGVINLPSGEAFISPNDAYDSHTGGYLPIGYDGEFAIYKVSSNRVVGVLGERTKLMDRIEKDSAVGNIAEFAFGVLGLFGIKSCGRVLLDEKLGLHIALGRNDHFGGRFGIESFKDKEDVWHQDFIYTEEMQPNVFLKNVRIYLKDDEVIDIIHDGEYNLEFLE